MKSYITFVSAAIMLAALTQGCETSENGNIPMIGVGLEDAYYIPRMQKLPLRSELTGENYEWELTTPAGETAVVSRSRSYIFLEAEEGKYPLVLRIYGDDGVFTASTTVNVMHEEIEYSPYISTVYEYCPAPGQFVNQMPMYEEGDTYATMLSKAERCIKGTADELITLGGWGGYVTFGFDHTIVSDTSSPELRIWGNAFYNSGYDGQGGSAEPGIIMVSFDENCNGVPDDTWYELAGSEFADTERGYAMTYLRPATENGAIHWTDNTGNSGTIPHLPFHRNGYFPMWIQDEELTFNGSLLPSNGSLAPGSSTDYILQSYPWGYADNHPNSETALNSFSFSNARDISGAPVSLPGVDFVRVYTGVNQICGAIGETSTEISRAADLNLLR